jgi:hypothetical protein
VDNSNFCNLKSSLNQTFSWSLELYALYIYELPKSYGGNVISFVHVSLYIASFGQHIIVYAKNIYITFNFPYGSKPAYSLPIILIAMLYNFLICQHTVIKFGMWLHLSYDIKKSMKFAGYAGLLRRGYLYLY